MRAQTQPLRRLKIKWQTSFFEIDRFARQTGCEMKPLAVREILDEEIGRKPV